MSLIFGIQPFFEMIGTFSTPYIIPRWVEHRVTLMTFLFLLGASTFLIGPFYGDLNLPVMLIGLTISGISLGPLVIPNMAEMMNATALKHPYCDLEHASSLLSGILNCCMGPHRLFPQICYPLLPVKRVPKRCSYITCPPEVSETFCTF